MFYPSNRKRRRGKICPPFGIGDAFQLATPFPQFPRRGLPVFEGSEHLPRMDPIEDKEGFFIALFARKSEADSELDKVKTSKKRKPVAILRCTWISKMLMLSMTLNREDLKGN